jgi:pimeloyl-ACP methyl ester carboxylesterase
VNAVSLARVLRDGAGLVGGLFFTAAGGWILYSRFGIDRRVPLPDALDAERRRAILAEAGQISYYVDTQGSESTRPLVLIHSINAAASAFEMKPLFDYYKGKRPVYALDLPGFGFAERSDRRYTPALYTGAITGFLRDVVGQPADVVALSLGSEFAAMSALLQPEQVASLALLSPTGFNAEDVEVPEDLLYGFFTFPLWSQPIYDLLVTRASIKLFLGRNFVGEPPDSLIDYAYATAHQPGARYAPLYFVSGQLFTTGVRDSIYAKLDDMPVLVIYDRDANVSFEALPNFLRDNQNWDAQRVAPSLGLPHWELTAETVAALERFWAE